MKSIVDVQDAERLIAFNGQSFGEGVAGMTSSLMKHHPDARPDYWLYVEDEASGDIVSSLCLIPWLWRYKDVILKIGEMGIVSTREAYRNRGIIRALTARHHEIMREEEFDLGVIQGIPYFYRQFGYEYAMPLEAHWNLQRYSIPDAWKEHDNAFAVRAATVDDIPILMSLYQTATASLNITTVRSADQWRFMFQHSTGTETETETWLLLDSDAQIVGYWCIALHGFGEGLIVGETSRLSVDAAKFVLYWLKTAAIQGGKPYIRMNLPPNNDLVQTARFVGAHNNGVYAWQIHLVDVARLLMKLKPVLERRLATSPFAGLSRKLVMNLYREAFELTFEQGKLLGVQSIGFNEGGEIRIPPLLLAQLVLGYRSIDELKTIYPDVSVWGESLYLLDILFPKLEAFIFPGY